MQIGRALSFARQGQQIAVQLPNGRVKKFIAATDITSTTVLIVGNQVISQDAARSQLTRTTQFFESKTNYEQGGRYPYLSVFINGQNQLVVTYNGGQRTLGDLPFDQLKAVNLNRLNSDIFTGTILSKDETKVISFSNKKIEPVQDLDILPLPWKSIGFISNTGDNPNEINTNLLRKLLGNQIYDYPNSYYYEFYAIKYLPLTNSFIHKKYLAPFGFRSPNYYGYDNPLSNNYFFVVDSRFYAYFNNGRYFYRVSPDSYTPITIAPQSYTYRDNRTITNYGANPASFSNSEFSWSFALTGQVVALKSGESTGLYPSYDSFPNNTYQPPPVTDTFNGTLTKSITEQKTNESDIAIEFPTVFDADGSSNGNTKITYKSNISRVVKHDSNFAVLGTAVTRWQQTFIQFVGYYLIPYTAVNIDYSGQANLSDTTTTYISAELLIPVPVCDRQLATKRIYLKRDDLDTKSASLSVANSPINGSSDYPISTPTPINQTLAIANKTIYENIDIDFIFNVGDLGVYREKQYAYTINETQDANGSSEMARGVLAQTADQPPDPNYQVQTTYTDIKSGIFIEESALNYSQYNIVKTKNISANFSFYKIAYLDNEPITAYPGFAGGASSLTPEKIVNFLSNSASNSTIELSLYKSQNINYVSKETVTITKLANQSAQSTNNYERINYPELEASSVDLVGQYVVYYQRYQNNSYLTLCRVDSVNVLYETNYGNSRTNPDSKYISTAQCTIISVKKVKFLNPIFSFFTVDGCAIFQYLDPYKTSLITVKNNTTDSDVYLAATMVDIETIYTPYATQRPAVTEKNTEALLFKLTETGFTFVAVVGGDISDFRYEKSPDAAYWIKYWDRPSTSFW